MTDFRRHAHSAPSCPAILPQSATRHAGYLPLHLLAALLSWLSQTDLVGYPNKPIWGGALLSGNELNSFDSAILSRCASICLITPARPGSLIDTAARRLGYDVYGRTNAAGAWRHRSGAPVMRAFLNLSASCLAQ